MYVCPLSGYLHAVEMLRISMTMQATCIPVVDFLSLGLPMPVRSTGRDQTKIQNSQKQNW